ncbi:MAG: hypothetical protein O2955_22030, partial [Planctomycetota bacterium]|nr:hypothetical protein [Planctomycetota bacterium]
MGSFAAPIALIPDAEAGQSALGSFAPTVIGLCSRLVSRLQKLGQVLIQNPAAAAHEYRGKLSASNAAVEPSVNCGNVDAEQL